MKRFSIKTMMIVTVVCAVFAWALAPTVHDVMTIHSSQAKNAAMQKILIEKGLNPRADKSTMVVHREYGVDGSVVRTRYLSK